MGWFTNKPYDVIHVKYVDLVTGNIFRQSKMPAARLPESFEAATTVQFDGQDWSVVEARPVTSADFRRTGELVLVLNKITKEFVNPSTILFSLPTITGDALPQIAAGTSKLGVDVLEIHEDDWRQIEWLPASAANIIDTELASVRRVIENERVDVGFKKCHLRDSIPKLAPNSVLRLSEMRAAFDPKATWLAGFAYQGVAGLAANSFAIRLFSSIEVFGVASNDIVDSICFANSRANNAPEPDVPNLANFAAAHDLLLVDWCRILVLRPSLANYMAYFNRQ